jgi:hypothetical protein
VVGAGQHLSSLDRNWTNVNHVFLLICQEWIRNTTYKEYRTAAPVYLRISVNKNYNVRGVELLCCPHAWPVPRRFLYFVDSSSWPNAFINLTSDGRWVQQGSIAENSSAGGVVLEHICKNGLDATTKVKGR